jgi:hypothetical protein
MAPATPKNHAESVPPPFPPPTDLPPSASLPRPRGVKGVPRRRAEQTCAFAAASRARSRRGSLHSGSRVAHAPCPLYGEIASPARIWSFFRLPSGHPAARSPRRQRVALVSSFIRGMSSSVVTASLTEWKRDRNARVKAMRAELTALRRLAPRAIDPITWANQRAGPLSRLTAALRRRAAGQRDAVNGVVSPTVRHLRRRTNAFRSRAVPVQIRLRHAVGGPAAGPAAAVQAVRAVRRRASRLNAAAEAAVVETVAAAAGGTQVAVGDGGGKLVRLPTHIWHAKRFHMDTLWGAVLPSTRCDAETGGLALRAATTAVLAHDESYLVPLAVTVPAHSSSGGRGVDVANAARALRRCLDPGTAAALAAHWGVAGDDAADAGVDDRVSTHDGTAGEAGAAAEMTDSDAPGVSAGAVSGGDARVTSSAAKARARRAAARRKWRAGVGGQGGTDAHADASPAPAEAREAVASAAPGSSPVLAAASVTASEFLPSASIGAVAATVGLLSQGGSIAASAAGVGAAPATTSAAAPAPSPGVVAAHPSAAAHGCVSPTAPSQAAAEVVELRGMLHATDAFPAMAIQEVVVTALPATHAVDEATMATGAGAGDSRILALLWLHPASMQPAVTALRTALAGLPGAGLSALPCRLARIAMAGPGVPAILARLQPPSVDAMPSLAAPGVSAGAPTAAASVQAVAFWDPRLPAPAASLPGQPSSPTLPSHAVSVWLRSSSALAAAVALVHPESAAATARSAGLRQAHEAAFRGGGRAGGGGGEHVGSKRSRPTSATPVGAVGGAGAADSDGEQEEGAFMTLAVAQPAKKLRLAIVEDGDDLREYDVGDAGAGGGDVDMRAAAPAAPLPPTSPWLPVAVVSVLHVGAPAGQAGRGDAVPSAALLVAGDIATRAVWSWLTTSKQPTRVECGGLTDWQGATRFALRRPAFPADFPDCVDASASTAGAHGLTAPADAGLWSSLWQGSEGAPAPAPAPVVVRGRDHVAGAVTATGQRLRAAHHDPAAAAPLAPWLSGRIVGPTPSLLSRPLLVVVRLAAIGKGSLQPPAAVVLVPAAVPSVRSTGSAPASSAGAADDAAACFPVGFVTATPPTRVGRRHFARAPVGGAAAAAPGEAGVAASIVSHPAESTTGPRTGATTAEAVALVRVEAVAALHVRPPRGSADAAHAGGAAAWVPVQLGVVCEGGCVVRRVRVVEVMA